MSNLQLPTLTRTALLQQFGHRLDRNHSRVRIAYETTAERNYDDGANSLVIRHHGNVIAELGDGWLYVTNAGHGSSTTRQRLNAILRDNGTHAAINQRSGAQILSVRTGTQRVAALIGGERFPQWDTDVPVMTDVRQALGWRELRLFGHTAALLREFRSAMLHLIDGDWMVTDYNGVSTPEFEASLREARAKVAR